MLTSLPVFINKTVQNDSEVPYKMYLPNDFDQFIGVDDSAFFASINLTIDQLKSRRVRHQPQFKTHLITKIKATFRDKPTTEG